MATDGLWRTEHHGPHSLTLARQNAALTAAPLILTLTEWITPTPYQGRAPVRTIDIARALTTTQPPPEPEPELQLFPEPR